MTPRKPKRPILKEDQNQNGDILDLPRPINLVGQTGFLKFGGGGRCSVCSKTFATLMVDGRCAEHTELPLDQDQEPTQADIRRRSRKSGS